MVGQLSEASVDLGFGQPALRVAADGKEGIVQLARRCDARQEYSIDEPKEPVAGGALGNRETPESRVASEKEAPCRTARASANASASESAGSDAR